MEEMIINDTITTDLKKIKAFVDYGMINKIINKLTDYAEILTEGKLSAIINYSYSLNSSQTNMITDILVEMQAISRIYIIAQKGKRDLEEEYFSNIFSDVYNPQSISAYISIRNMMENRLSHQVQQYNMNMNKSNTTLAMPINELHGHVKTMKELSKSSVILSHKAQHGYIAASLHDAYVRILNRPDWWDDKTYIKYFFNEDDNEKRKLNLIGRTERFSLIEISENISKVLKYFEQIEKDKLASRAGSSLSEAEEKNRDMRTSSYSDKLLLTPFGKQYGTKIDSIIDDIFDEMVLKQASLSNEDDISEKVLSIYQIYKTFPASLSAGKCMENILDVVNFLLTKDFSAKKFTELYLYLDRKISFLRYYAQVKNDVENFITEIFAVYFENRFSTLFKIIRSLDMKQYACAFIIKRIYLKQGESLTTFGYFLIKSISRYGKIKVV